MDEKERKMFDCIRDQKKYLEKIAVLKLKEVELLSQLILDTPIRL